MAATMSASLVRKPFASAARATPGRVRPGALQVSAQSGRDNAGLCPVHAAKNFATGLAAAALVLGGSAQAAQLSIPQQVYTMAADQEPTKNPLETIGFPKPTNTETPTDRGGDKPLAKSVFDALGAGGIDEKGSLKEVFTGNSPSTPSNTLTSQGSDEALRDAPSAQSRLKAGQPFVPGQVGKGNQGQEFEEEVSRRGQSAVLGGSS